jgi:GNAT superfamily N-acetyltransferase
MYSLTEVELDHPALVALFAGLSDALGGEAEDEPKLSYTEAGLLTAVVAWHDGKAVGCGLLRQADSSKAEIKRMYSLQAGVGSAILYFLEQKALAAGFQSVLASVRIINAKALNFYLHKGYKKCPSYGKYRYSSQHMCLEKPLSQVVTV